MRRHQKLPRPDMIAIATRVEGNVEACLAIYEAEDRLYDMAKEATGERKKRIIRAADRLAQIALFIAEW